MENIIIRNAFKNSNFVVNPKSYEEAKKIKVWAGTYVEVWGYYEDACADFVPITVPFGCIEKMPYKRGTRVLNRTYGTPYAAIKRALRVMKKWNVTVEECFDGNHYNTNSSIDEYLQGDDEFAVEISNAIATLQWAGFKSRNVLCAYDPPLEAYTLEKKIK